MSINKINYYRDVCYVLDQLPHNYQFALNLCTDRYYFLVAFHAISLKGQTNLLPPNQIPAIQQQIIQQYQPSYVLSDQCVIENFNVPIIRINLANIDTNHNSPEIKDLSIPLQQQVAILFTSGTTGTPQPVYKIWKELITGVQLSSQIINSQVQSKKLHLISTVSPQHMFGLEFSIILPLIAGIDFYSGQPFFPADIYTELLSAKNYSILITTPVHLQILIKSGIEWQRCGCQLIVCSTAPLHKELALQVETQFAAPALEIYGSTETGAIASRRPTQNDELNFYPGIAAQPCNEGFIVSGAHLSAPILLNDHIAINNSGNFHLIGRQDDLIKIAGKRASLSELNYRLTQIPGIIDGVFINTADSGKETQRLTAIVVAPNMQREEILGALIHWIDPVFLPRPLLLVDALPRTANGKLPQQPLHDLLNQHRQLCT